jgi:hypothetical protein
MDTKLNVAVETDYLCPVKNVATLHDIEWYTGYIMFHNDDEYDILVYFT